MHKAKISIEAPGRWFRKGRGTVTPWPVDTSGHDFMLWNSPIERVDQQERTKQYTWHKKEQSNVHDILRELVSEDSAWMQHKSDLLYLHVWQQHKIPERVLWNRLQTVLWKISGKETHGFSYAPEFKWYPFVSRALNNWVVEGRCFVLWRHAYLLKTYVFKYLCHDVILCFLTEYGLILFEFSFVMMIIPYDCMIAS